MPWRKTPGLFSVECYRDIHVLEAARLEKVDQVIYSAPFATYRRIFNPTSLRISLFTAPTMYGATKVFGSFWTSLCQEIWDRFSRGPSRPWSARERKNAHMSIYHAWAIEEPLKGNPTKSMLEPGQGSAIYLKTRSVRLWLALQSQEGSDSTMIYTLPNNPSLLPRKTGRGRFVQDSWGPFNL